MLNIVIGGKLKDEQQLIESSVLPANAVQFKEGEDITEVLKTGGLIGLPILIVMLGAGLNDPPKMVHRSTEGFFTNSSA